MTSPVQRSSWTVAWPAERDALVRAIATATAWPDLVGPFEVHVRGNVQDAEAGVAADLLAAGVDPEWFTPDVTYLPAALGAPRAVSIAHLPETVADGCEYERRPYVDTFALDDPDRANVWTLARQAVAQGRATAVTVVTESLEGHGDLQERAAVTVVAGSIAVRRRGRRRGIRTVPRPPAPEHLPADGVVVVDARRPDDVALVVRAGASYLLANADHVNAPALVALGVPVEVAVEAVFALPGTPQPLALAA
jgi:hypothetical protein